MKANTIFTYVLQNHLYAGNSSKFSIPLNWLETGTWPTLGPAIQFENLLPGNLCQSVDLFGRNKFPFLTNELQFLRNLALPEV